MNVTFITGNQDKVNYLARVLGMKVQHQKIDLDEVQSEDLEKIVEHKVRQAYSIINEPVIVDDVALGFTVLGGLPGPFIKFFVEQPDGLEKLCRMLDGFADRSATGICTIGYYDGTRLRLFTGKIEGAIADYPKGEQGYGWDKIFIPEGYGGKTRAELSSESYDELYQVIRPVAQLREFLTSIA